MKVYLIKEAYDLDNKFDHYQKKFTEAFKICNDHGEAKRMVFITWPEYKELFGAIDFPEYQPTPIPSIISPNI